MVKKITGLFVLLSICFSKANAETLFEGYAKILSDGQHIGYIISRYEFDSKKNHFISTYFLKSGKGPTEVTESLHAVADSELNPISYEYTTLDAKGAKTIDAKFKSGTLSAIVRADGKSQKIEKKIPKGTFLSTFLVYLILKSKEGLHTDASYDYQAIAEEEALVVKGQALVQKEEMYKGFKAFKVINTFKDSKFLSYINERGEVLGTNALGQAITTELVANASDATAGQSFSASILKTLFGSVPQGTENVFSRNSKKTESTPPTKAVGVPQGQGIIIKTTPDEKKGQ